MAPRAAARLETLGFEQVFEYLAGKLDWLAAGNPTEGENSKRPRAGDVARKDVLVCALKDRVGEVRKRAGASGWDVAVVIDDARVVLGLLRSEQLEEESGLSVEKAMRPGPSTFRPYVPIKEMADYMVEHRLDSVPITTSEGKLVGVLFKHDATREAAATGSATTRRMITS